jgi:sporulation protein YqfC
VINSFLQEIAEFTELPFDIVFSSYRYTVFGGVSVYVQGHKGFSAFSPEKVVLRAGKKRLEINGENLVVRQLSNDDITVSGTIRSVAEAEG